jgi:DNA (cytosine-5)-methyltransferase 1
VTSGLTIGSLFSGIGGLELGLEWAGHGPTLWQVERDEYCQRVLAKHWPGAERYDDVRTVGADLAPVDIICGGFPCQDNSSAHTSCRRAGLSGNRSGLWQYFAELLGWMEPTWVVVENVASGAQLWVDQCREDMGRLGYETLPLPLGASDVGAPHIRPRVFIVGRNTDSDTQPMGPVDAKAPRVPRASWAVSPWAEPPRVSVADGSPAELAAVGNAVVPQCAQVVGEVINLMRGNS